MLDKFDSRGDPQLREDVAQVVVDGARAQEELGGDLPVGGALADEPGDLEFLRGELTEGARVALATGFRGRSSYVPAQGRGPVAGRRGVLRSPLRGLPASNWPARPVNRAVTSSGSRRQLLDARAVATSRPRVRPRWAVHAATTRRSSPMLADRSCPSFVQVSG